MKRSTFCSDMDRHARTPELKKKNCLFLDKIVQFVSKSILLLEHTHKKMSQISMVLTFRLRTVNGGAEDESSKCSA